MHGYRNRLIAFAGIFLVSITLGMLVTQEVRRIPLRAEQLAPATGIHEFDWSADGKSIAYIGATGGGFDLWMIPSSGGKPIRLTSTLRFKKQPRWSADGKWIAFITMLDNGNTDIQEVSVEGQSLTVLTDTTAQEDDLAWSPDSTQIAFTERTGSQTRIMSVDVKTGVSRKLADTPAWDLRWSPDGKWIAFVADLLQPRDDRRENTDIFLIPSDGGVPRLLTPGTPRFRDMSPDWSADSQRIVYTSDETGYSNVYALDIQTGSKTTVTAGSVEILSPKWSPSATTVAYVRHENSMFHVYTVSVGDGLTSRVSQQDGVNAGYSDGYGGVKPGPLGTLAWSPDGKRIAFTHSDPGRTSDIWIGTPDGTHLNQLTDSMPEDLRRESRFVWPDRVTYRSFDGQEIAALVYKPKGTRPQNGHPALLYFRDTLDGENAAVWDPIVQFLVSNGYLVFAPNVRGSGGRGRTYRGLVAGQGGDHDVRDALFGLDRLSSEGSIDNERLGILGTGTGGFLTAATLSRGETRFKAAVCINAIVDATTAASQPETTEWSRYMIGGAPLENPLAYYERSLVNFVDKLRTPIILLYSGHTPSPGFQQLQEFAVHAEVKGRWYDYRVFENESGDWRTWRPANTRYALEAMEAMFDKYVMGRDREVRLTRSR